MSFGVSPSDVVKLVEVSTRIYVAFKDANDNSEAQVEALVREFSNFHHCLLELDDLMKEYGKPLPFPYLDFKETLERCDKTLKPYANHLVDNRRMTAKKFTYIIKYIGKEKEIDGLRKQINGHYQALQMCISFLQLRLHLEATKQTQRLLDSVPFRAMSFGGHMYSSNAFASTSRATPNALPAPSEADQLYKDWLVFNRWLKNEDDRIALEAGGRPLSLGATPARAPGGDAESAAVLYHMRRELEDAIAIEENRAKRVAAEKRTTLSPSDAIRQEIKTMPSLPHRTYTLETDHSGNFSGFNHQSLSDSSATLRPSPGVSPTTSPSGSPQIQQGYFGSVDWGHLSPTSDRTPASSTTGRSSVSTTDSRLSVSGVSTMETTPEDHPLRSRHSTTSLITLALGPNALEWNSLCRKTDVERTTAEGTRSKKCELHWRYSEDHGISIRSVCRDERTKKVSVWMTQHFPATGPSIPLTTSYPDGETSIDFPRGSFGRLEKRCTDIKYTFPDAASSSKLQTLLYTNNGKDPADLLFDKPIISISSDKHKPECRGKNVRLWRRTELQDGPNGVSAVDVLVLLFYTSALPEERAHWVEEPHYVFQWLDDSVAKKSSESLKLTFSKEPGKWSRDKLFKARKTSRASSSSDVGDAAGMALASLRRTDTGASSSAASVRSSRSSIFGGGAKRGLGSLNRFGYAEIEIKFGSKKDRKEFLTIWMGFVKPLGWNDRE